MNKIIILPTCEAQKIAAGEVVERPANIVKELVENALDAQAKKITLMLQDGGKKLIRLIDDGCGMSPDDARLCIAPHATSKIKTVDELDYLSTFGFRGEALASIAAISRMTLTTKTSQSTTGLRLSVENGIILGEEIVAAPDGTDIIIEDLFYNVPARKKFLKSTETEWRTIYQLMQALTLAHPQCLIRVFHNGHESLACPPTTLSERAQQLFDDAFTKASLSTTYKDETYDITITGSCTNHQYHRYDRSQLFFFVNNRWIKNYKLGQALLRGYRNILPTDRYPAAVVYITCKPSDVDINIHPRKEEVMFLHPRMIERAIEQWATLCLQKDVIETFKPAPPQISTSLWHPTVLPAQHRFENSSYSAPIKTQSTQMLESFIPDLKQEVASPVQQRVIVDQVTPSYHLIGQLKTTYILIEQHEGLVMIDQHAAHEAILFEEISTTKTQNDSIQLLFPPLLTLSPQQISIVQEYQDLFKQNNILLEQQNNSTWALKSVPLILKHCAGSDFIEQLIGIMQEEQTNVQEIISKKVHAMMACKAAVKAGDTLTTIAMHELVDKLLTTPNTIACPHGRPTRWKITFNEIERYFKRTI